MLLRSPPVRVFTQSVVGPERVYEAGVGVKRNFE